MAMSSPVLRKAPERVRPPRARNLVCDPVSEDVENVDNVDNVSAGVDWSSWYVTDEEDMAEGYEQGVIIREFLSALGELARERIWTRTLIGSDQFFAWVPSEPLVRVSPDVYLLDDPPPPPRPSMWQTWLPGHRAPRFALEVVSENWRKDYEQVPAKYALLGARELVIFDPEVASGAVTSQPRAPRHALQVYRRTPDDKFVRVYQGAGPVHSTEIDAWLFVRPEGAVVRLRLSRDPEGRALVPTAEEAREAEASAREAAEREVTKLRAELERLSRRAL